MKLFLFDGSALAHRSYNAFKERPLTVKGVDVSMLYGFLSTLLSVIRREKPDYLALCFDTSAPTFRHARLETYKGTRKALDDNMRTQLPILNEVIELLNIPSLKLDGYEADDIVATLAKQAEAKGMEVMMVTGDKDFMQLISDKVKMYKLPYGGVGNAEVFGAEQVHAKLGITPEQTVDYLALLGDVSDNVPGVPGVGEKTAIQLVQKFGGLDEILKRVEEVDKPRIKQSLIDNAEKARLSRELIVLDTNVPIGLKPKDLTFGPLDNPTARKKLVELEFRSILAQIDAIGEVGNRGIAKTTEGEAKEKEVAKAEVEKKYQLVNDHKGLDKLVTLLESCRLKHWDKKVADGIKWVSFDTETTGRNPMLAELVGMSFSITEGEAFYVAANAFEGVPDDYKAPPAPRLRPNQSRELSYILSRLGPIYSDHNIPKCGQNIKYDMMILACHGVETYGVAFDSIIASHLLDPNARQHGIDQLAEIYLDFRKITTHSLIGSGAKQITMLDVPVEKVSEYACEDADIALRLCNVFLPKIRENEFEKVLFEQELPLLPVLMKMEKTGITLNQKMLAKMSVEFAEELAHLEEEVHKLAGKKFNLNSTKQLADILFKDLGLPPGKKTQTGFSTDVDELERLAPVHEVPARLLRYRTLTKLKSTYIDSLPLMIHPITGRIHTNYSQVVAATGRLASNDPNLQNIPIRSEEGGRIRKAFVAGEEGWKILSADYSQIELRIMAHISRDEKMIEGFKSGGDIHRATAAWMMGVEPDQVTSDMRRAAKEVNFGVLYGMTDFGLASRLGITRARAKEFIESYFGNFPQVKGCIDEIIREAREKGYVSTLMGRRRPVPEITSKNFNIRSLAERVAVNTPMQGSAADLMKLAMIQVQAMLDKEGFETRMLLQVHDELVFEAPEKEIKKVSERIRSIMSGAMDLIVPLEVGVGSGDSWLEAHE